MKVEYIQGQYTRAWFWRTSLAESTKGYSRRRDAVRGFERFCAAIVYGRNHWQWKRRIA